MNDLARLRVLVQLIVAREGGGRRMRGAAGVEASTLAARLGACISRQVRAARGMAWQLSVACGAGVRRSCTFLGG